MQHRFGKFRSLFQDTHQCSLIIHRGEMASAKEKLKLTSNHFPSTALRSDDHLSIRRQPGRRPGALGPARAPIQDGARLSCLHRHGTVRRRERPPRIPRAPHPRAQHADAQAEDELGVRPNSIPGPGLGAGRIQQVADAAAHDDGQPGRPACAHGAVLVGQEWISGFGRRERPGQLCVLLWWLAAAATACCSRAGSRQPRPGCCRWRLRCQVCARPHPPHAAGQRSRRPTILAPTTSCGTCCVRSNNGGSGTEIVGCDSRASMRW